MRRRTFTRIADDNDVPTEPGTYRRIYDYWPPCTFHKFIALDDWARPATPRRSPV